MKIFQKKKDGYQPQSKLEKRIASISTPELVGWAENSLFVIGRDLTGWLRSKDALQLEEAAMGAEALQAVVRELQRRSDNDFR